MATNSGDSVTLRARGRGSGIGMLSRMRPGRILESIPIPLPRPRERSVTLSPEFVAIKERCLKLLTAAAPKLEEAA